MYLIYIYNLYLGFHTRERAAARPAECGPPHTHSWQSQSTDACWFVLLHMNGCFTVSRFISFCCLWSIILRWKSHHKSVYITKITTLNLTIMLYLENTRPSALVKNANFSTPWRSTLPVGDISGSTHWLSEAEWSFSVHHTLTPSI